MYPKRFGPEKIVVRNNLGQQKFWFRINLGSEKILDQNFRPKLILGLKKCLNKKENRVKAIGFTKREKNVGKKISMSPKISLIRKSFGTKKFCSEKILSQSIFWGKKIGFKIILFSKL